MEWGGVGWDGEGGAGKVSKVFLPTLLLKMEMTFISLD
jgi:phage tail tube protein FII